MSSTLPLSKLTGVPQQACARPTLCKSSPKSVTRRVTAPMEEDDANRLQCIRCTVSNGGSAIVNGSSVSFDTYMYSESQAANNVLTTRLHGPLVRPSPNATLLTIATVWVLLSSLPCTAASRRTPRSTLLPRHRSHLPPPRSERPHPRLEQPHPRSEQRPPRSHRRQPQPGRPQPLPETLSGQRHLRHLLVLKHRTRHPPQSTNSHLPHSRL